MKKIINAKNPDKNKSGNKNNKIRGNKYKPSEAAFKKDVIKSKNYKIKLPFAKSQENLEVEDKINNIADNESLRIAKFIAQSGICSRRDAEKLIFEGKVKINDQIIDNPAIKVTLKDKVKVNDEMIGARVSAIYLYHKPKGLVTTHSDEKGRETVFENLPSYLSRLISVGRLDINSEGLLILTTDSNIAHYLESPKNKMARTYQVRVFGKINESKLAQIASKGLKYKGIYYQKFDYHIISQTNNNSWLEITIFEGKNREIRNIMEFLELKISRLIRIAYGKFSLGDLKPGQIIKVSDIVTNNILTEINAHNHRSS